ncbi:hypothetical protein P7C73_g2659, partial [Tremellales sp. Uapishka_1]
MSAPTPAIEAAAAAELHPYRATNFSAILLSLCIDLFMLGILTQQSIQWFTYRRNERRIITLLVYVLGLCSLVMTGLVMGQSFDHFGVHFGEYYPWLSTKWTCFWPFCDTVIATLIFYLERAFLLNNRNWYIVGFMGILWPLAWGSSLAVLGKFSQLATETQAPEIAPILFVWFSAIMTIDIAITASIGWGLWKSRTGWSQTDQMIGKLMMVSVETQLPPTLIAIAFLIVFSRSQASFMCIFFECIQSKFYVVGFMAVLNSRHKLRREMDGGSDFNDVQRKTNTFVMKGTRPLGQETINIVTETYVESFSIQPDSRGINRAHFDPDLKEIQESDTGSEVNLDYISNASKTGLNKNYSPA